MGDAIGIILAAGESKRMGAPKALLAWRGRTFVERVEEGILAAGLDDVRVIVGAWARGRALPVRRARVLENPRPEAGPISSIRVGLAGVPSEARFALVALVDHPAVREETYRAVAELARSRPGEVIIPTHDGHGGHPVAFPRELFAMLLDPVCASARDAVARHPHVHRWECGDAGVLTDLDTPEELERSQP